MPVVEEWTYLNAFFLLATGIALPGTPPEAFFCEQDRLPFSDIITLDVTNAMRIYLPG